LERLAIYTRLRRQIQGRMVDYDLEMWNNKIHLASKECIICVELAGYSNSFDHDV